MFKNRFETGFSLVEIMVALVISLIITFIILQMFTNYERHHRVTTSGIDAQQNGQIAIYLLEQQLRLAGFGLAVDELLECTDYYTYYDVGGGSTDSPIANFSTTAVTITDGGPSPDQIIVRYGNSMRAHQPVILDAIMAADDNDLSVDSLFGHNVGELILISNSTGDCSLRQIIGIDIGDTDLEADEGIPPYNAPETLITSEGWPGYSPLDRVYNLGMMVVRNYAVSGGATSTLTAQDMDQVSPVPLVDDIVDLQAQYGVSATASSTDVTQWVDATGGTWTTPSATDRKRIKAVRFAVVARTSVSETGNVSPATIKLWPDSGSGQTTIGPIFTVPDRRYRYKVFQTVVPLRNLLWASLS